MVKPEVSKPILTLRAAKKRVLIVVNPYATTVSDRLKNLVVYALRGKYRVEAVDTESPNHATDIGRIGAQNGFDMVVAFGGDGTANEVANGIAGSDIPLTFLPGGATNVMCRTLGIPNDIVAATEHLLALSDNFKPRRVDLAGIDDRYFLFTAGIGLDAEAFKKVDEHPRLKAKLGEFYFSASILSTYYLDYLRHPHNLRMEVNNGSPIEGKTMILQNSDPVTYFGKNPLRICENISFTDGTLSVAALKRVCQRDIPGLAYLLLSQKKSVTHHRQVDCAEGFTEARLTTLDRDAEGNAIPFPIQVDGEFVGRFTDVRFGVHPNALTVVA